MSLIRIFFKYFGVYFTVRFGVLKRGLFSFDLKFYCIMVVIFFIFFL